MKMSRFSDSISISICSIILLAFDEGLNIDRRDKANVMAEPWQLAPPIMGRAARLHRNYARWQCSYEFGKLKTREFFTKQYPTVLCRTVNLKTCFARSTPTMLTSSMDASSVVGDVNHHHHCTLRCRWEGLQPISENQQSDGSGQRGVERRLLKKAGSHIRTSRFLIA